MAQVLPSPTEPSLPSPPTSHPQPTITSIQSIDYGVIQNRLKEFLQSFAQDDFTHGSKLKYMTQISEIHTRQRKSLVIDIDDIYKWGMVSSTDDSRRGATGLLHDDIIQNARRYQELFSQATDEILDAMRSNTDPDNNNAMQEDDDGLNVLLETRRIREEAFRNAQMEAENIPQDARNANASNVNLPTTGGDPRNLIPAVMTRTYDTLLIPRSMSKSTPLRFVRSEHVGQLVSVTGIVTRVTEVKPKITVAVYVCHGCGYEVYQEVNGRSYIPIMQCPTGNHVQGGGGELMPNYTACRYTKYQELKLQEPADQVPIGNIPRSLNIKLCGELTRTCTSGDIVKVVGIFLPMPFTGYKAMKAGFLADTFIEAMEVGQLKKNYDDSFVDDDTKHNLHMLKHEDTEEIYKRLSRSIAPEIFGHEDIKKALLLLLLSAPAKKLPDGMRLRGDLHICLMGDPGVAKSQFLKHITTIAPRAIYTTGKGSSGVGLTAAVMRDVTTNELMLEGGALVLADLGIACIDEFDKMNESDRTAIHEVMEQQTVSIAKAGITTSLNARTSILAASNPAYGRYNRHKSPAENINLPAALLSRFDLLFLLLDKPKAETDLLLAKHVTCVHRTGRHPKLDFDVVDGKVLKAYISEARRVNPIIPVGDEDEEGLTEYLIGNYIEMRGVEIDAGKGAKEYTSPRVLLSILRLAQACCRLRLSNKVMKKDIDEALRLMKSSKSSLEDDLGKNRRRGDDDADEMDLDNLIKGDDDRQGGDKIWTIYTVISEYMQTHVRTVIDIGTAEGLVESEGFTKEDLMKTIEQYEDMDIWTYDNREHRIALV